MSVKNLQLETGCLPTSASPSKFTYKHLRQLRDSKTAYKSPLSIIGFIDLNAFFAQCEQIRLGLPDEAPVVCAQWQSLIAVSYPARKYGINRMDTVLSARSKCPDIIIAHAAAFRKGEYHWLYLDTFPDQAIYKVSLDPYRRESRKILKVLQAECDLVEKASVDECYFDMGRLLYDAIVEKFPYLANEVSGDDPLPPIPAVLPEDCQWYGDIVRSHEEEKADQNTVNDSQAAAVAAAISDWDDIIMLLGSHILYDFRFLIRQKLGYLTSGGLARNKRLAKLAGGFRKPDMQTVVRNQLIRNFLKNFELTDIGGMGGKIGSSIIDKFEVPPGTNSINFIRENFTRDQIKQDLNDDALGEKVHQLVHGDYDEELTMRTAVKSMMSRKNFLKPVATLFDAFEWIKVFVGDLYSRLIELDDENLNLSMLQEDVREKGFIMRPKTMSIHLTSTSWNAMSKQMGLPISRDLEKLRDSMISTSFKVFIELLESSSVSKLNENVKLKDLNPNSPQSALAGYKIMPLANLSVVISNFLKTADSNLIDTYMKSDSKLSMKRFFDEVNGRKEPESEPEPKRKTLNQDDKAYIAKLFKDMERESEPVPDVSPTPEPKPKGPNEEDKEYIKKLFQDFEGSKTTKETPPTPPKSHPAFLSELIKTQFCSQCNMAVEDVFEHADFHYAIDLSDKLNRLPTENPLRKPEPKQPAARASKKKLAKGQTRLPF